MHIINKVFTIIILIILIPIVTLMLAFPTIATGLFTNLANSYTASVTNLGAQSSQVMIGIAAAVDLLLILILFFEIKQSKPTKAQVKLIGGGTAEVTFEAVSQRLKVIKERVGGIVSVHSDVRAKRKKIDVRLEVGIMPETNVPNKIEQLQSIVKEIVEQQMGLHLASTPEIKVRHASGLEKLGQNSPFGSGSRHAEAAPRTPTPPPPPPLADGSSDVPSDTGMTEIRG